jgi:hypothetical protein
VWRPTDDSLDLNLVADTRLSVTVVTDEAAAGDRVGFVCREGTGRYHLTVARDGIWRIEKVADGQLITHSACQNKRGHPGHGLDLAEGGLYRRRVGQTGAAGALGERGQAARPGSRPRSASVRGGRGGNCRGRPDPFSAAFGVRPLVSMNLARESRSLDGV